MMRDHRRLKAFQLADEVALEVYRLTKRFPKDELFGLTSQMRRAAVSVASNIVEGAAKDSERDFVRFLDMAFASAKELEYQATLAIRLGYINPDSAGQIVQRTEETSRVLRGLLKSFRERREN